MGGEGTGWVRRGHGGGQAVQGAGLPLGEHKQQIRHRLLADDRCKRGADQVGDDFTAG